MDPPWPSPAEPSSDDERRAEFNAARFWERARAGELEQKIVRSSTLKHLPAGEPPGTRSQLILYVDSSASAVALVHQYTRPDGSVGGAGRPDPKAVVTRDGRTLRERRRDGT